MLKSNYFHYNYINKMVNNKIKFSLNNIVSSPVKKRKKYKFNKDSLDDLSDEEETWNLKKKNKTSKKSKFWLKKRINHLRKLNLEEKNNEFIIIIIDNKIIIGNYDKLKYINNKQEGRDYIAFIDPYNNEQYKDTNWTVVPLPEEVKNLPINHEIKKKRYIKTHPHLFFKNYYLSIYIDGTSSIIGDLNQFVLRKLNLKLYRNFLK